MESISVLPEPRKKFLMSIILEKMRSTYRGLKISLIQKGRQYYQGTNLYDMFAGGGCDEKRNRPPTQKGKKVFSEANASFYLR